jgi:YVTN family beta-propeller protein
MLREVTDEITVGSEPWQPAFADGAIWVSNRGDGTVSRIDIETRQVTHTIQVGNGALTPLAFDGAIWVPDPEDGTVTRIETR